MPRRPLAEHRFGSDFIHLKLSIVERYLTAFTIALRQKFPSLWYIDAFAGTGERTATHDAKPADMFAEAVEAQVEARRGSAAIALGVTPAFDRLVFVDIRARYCKALEQLAVRHPDRAIDVVKGDANQIVQQIARAPGWRGRRAVLLLDPYGMHVEWATLEAIRSTEAIDLWYLLSVEGLFRRAPHDRAKLTAKKRAAITRVVGTAEWEEVWYRPHSTQGEFDFGVSGGSRNAGVDEMVDYFFDRLSGLFPVVLRPLRLSNKRGAPAFALFFAMSNPDAKAAAVATRIAGQILRSGISSHTRPRN